MTASTQPLLEEVADVLIASLAERRAERMQLDRIERKLNALCKAMGGPLKELDLSEPTP